VGNQLKTWDATRGSIDQAYLTGPNIQ